MTVPIYHVAAFTDQPFAGNPAAVCLLERPADDRWLAGVAADMNLSETAFLLPRPDGYHLRWFTPAVEVELCGHATLASAHVLWEAGRLRPDQPALFHTRSGLLTATRHGDDILMDFPARPADACEEPPGLCDALGVRATFVGRNGMDYLVVVESEEAVRDLKPDFGRLATFPVRGVIVTARASAPRFDFVSRFFAPGSGINEDPVTGSAHCCLGPYWGEKLDKTRLVGLQLSKRTGVVRVGLRAKRVDLGGRALTVLRGELCV